MTKKLLVPLLLLPLLMLAFKIKKPPKVLIMSKTNGFYHSSIPAGIAAIQKLGRQNGFSVDTTTDSLSFNTKNLKQYAAIIFLNTTGTILGTAQKAAFQQYIRNGGGFAGVHAATDTEFDWPWYNQLAGAYFESHPAQQTAKLLVLNKKHIATQHLPNVWERKDEWYNFKSLNKKVNVLITIDEKSYRGGKNGANHPMAWFHNFEGGRAFYTALGHTDESYTEPLFLQHLLGGIQYAMGIQ